MEKPSLEVLNAVFGYDAFRENQAEVIQTVLDGGDAFVLMPTGGGKSICYQIPAILTEGVGIVVSPLIALMEDQVKSLRQNGVRAAFLNSTLSYREAQAVQRKAAAGGVDILYVAPERMLTENFRHFLSRIRIALFAIDEAHCVSQWGHDFRPEYLRLKEVTDAFAHIPKMALTATADGITRKDIVEKLGLEGAAQYISSFDRPNICYRVQIKNREKQQLLAFIRKEHPNSPGIVYARTRKRVDAVAAFLCEQGIAAAPYHAGLAPAIRFEHQRRFEENDLQVITATIAFGLGIDKPDVRFVAHLDLPASMEAYYQETGRAGRDGLPADAWMVYSLADVAALHRLFELSEGSEGFKSIQRKKLQALLGFCEAVECRRRLLLGYFGESRGGGCTACDNCLRPVETWDGTVAAQKALSCVYRTGQRFGAAYLADVLTGKETDQVRRWRHQRIKTFGVGTELDKKGWMSVFRQLLSADVLSVDLGDKAGFRLNAQSWAVMKGRQTVALRKDLADAASENPRKARRAAEAPVPEADAGLFENLRTLRLSISRTLGLPPYVVFHDKTLREMAAVKPATMDGFLQVTGVGEAKAKRYGELFLACIRGDDVDVEGSFEEAEKAGAGDRGSRSPEEIPGGGRETIPEAPKEEKQRSARTAGTPDGSPPAAAVFQLGSATGRYQNEERYAEDGKKQQAEPQNWEPDKRTKEFVHEKIRALGCLKKVAEFYSEGHLLDRYAIGIAPAILGESPVSGNDGQSGSDLSFAPDAE